MSDAIMSSPIGEQRESPSTFVSFKDTQRTRHRAQGTASTPQRTTVSSTRYMTPNDPTLSSIASVRYGATPSWYEDGTDASEWVGGGGGGASVSRAVRAPVPSSSSPVTTRTGPRTTTSAPSVRAADELVSRVSYAPLPMAPASRPSSPLSGSNSPRPARSSTRSPPREPVIRIVPHPQTIRSAVSSTTRGASAPQASSQTKEAARSRSDPSARVVSRNPPTSSEATPAATRRPASKPREKTTLAQTRNSPLSAHDRRLADRDYRLRHGDGFADTSNPYTPLTGSSSSLTLALSAHWQSVQSFLEATAPLDGRAPVLVGAEAEQVRERVEADLLTTLALMPKRAKSAVTDAAGVVPLLLAFGIAPVPTVRTQIIALGALKALLLSMRAAMGAAAATEFVDDVLLSQHHGLEALEVAFVAAVQLSEKMHSAALEQTPRVSSSSSPRSSSSLPSDTRQAELTAARTLLLNVLELLTALTALSSHFVRACLATAASELVRCVVQYIPATLSQSEGTSVSWGQHGLSVDAAVGGFLLALCEREHIAADVLVAYGGHRAVADHLRVLFRHADQHTSTSSTCSAAGTPDTMTPIATSVHLYLRLFVRLVRGCPHAFRHLCHEPGLAMIVKSGLTSPWGPLVEVTGILLSALLQANPEPEHGGQLAQRVLADAASIAVLTGLLVSQQSRRYATTAALAWRWLALVQPNDCAYRLSHDTGLLTALLQVLLYHAMPTTTTSVTDVAAASPTGMDNTVTDEAAVVPLLLVESTLAMCVAVALGSLDARKQLVRVLHRQLSQTTRDTLREKLDTYIAAMSDDYLDTLPRVQVRTAAGGASTRNARADVEDRPPSTRSSTRTAASATRVLYQTAELASTASGAGSASRPNSSRGRSRSADQSSADGRDATDSAGPTSGQPTAENRRTGVDGLVVDSAALWRRLLNRTVRELFRDVHSDPQKKTASLSQSGVVDMSSITRRPGGVSAAVVAPTLLTGRAPAHSVRIDNADDSSPVTIGAPGTDLSLRGGEATRLQVGGVRSRVLGLDALRYREHPVCRRASHVMGPRLLQASIEVVLQLAQSYAASAPLPVSSARTSAAQRTPLDRSAQVRKAANPWAPRPPARAQQRRWTVEELEPGDVLLFAVRADNLVEDMRAALSIVTDHLRYLYRQLQICPQKAMARRCVLTDLYRNVYPKMHLFLRYIDSQIGHSRAVLPLLASMDGGVLHSGNIIGAYDNVGVCVGDQPSEHWA